MLFLENSFTINTIQYRNIIIDIFKKKVSLKKQDVKDACLREIGSEMPQSGNFCYNYEKKT